MDMTFEVDTNLDLPSLVSRNRMIETIIMDIGQADTRENMWGWTMEDIIRTYYTPSDSTIIVSNNNNIQLVPNNKIKTWYDLFKMYGIKYNKSKHNIYLHCMINYNIDDKKKSLVI